MLRSSYSSKNSVFLCTVMKDWQKVTMGFLSRQDSERSPSPWLKSSWDKLVLSKKKTILRGQLVACSPRCLQWHAVLLSAAHFCELWPSSSCWFSNWYWNKARMPLSQIWLVVRQVLCYYFETCGAVMLLGPAFKSAVVPAQAVFSELVGDAELVQQRRERVAPARAMLEQKRYRFAGQTLRQWWES